MTLTRALIEAAEAVIASTYSQEPEPWSIIVHRLRAAISSAKAAEECVETDWRIEGKRFRDSHWEAISLAEPKTYDEAIKLADGWKSESPVYISFHETRIVRKDTYTTVIE